VSAALAGGTRDALLIPREHWRSRWLVTGRWTVLHRIASIAWDDDDLIGGDGEAVCGVRGRFRMPGIFSRMGLPRCARCCKRLGVPVGGGAPFNVLAGRLQHV
jgi:hypothetical protein